MVYVIVSSIDVHALLEMGWGGEWGQKAWFMEIIGGTQGWTGYLLYLYIYRLPLHIIHFVGINLSSILFSRFGILLGRVVWNFRCRLHIHLLSRYHLVIWFLKFNVLLYSSYVLTVFIELFSRLSNQYYSSCQHFLCWCKLVCLYLCL